MDVSFVVIAMAAMADDVVGAVVTFVVVVVPVANVMTVVVV